MHWAAMLDYAPIELELWHYGCDEKVVDSDGDTAIVRRC